jgi:hypothetical protein
MTEISRWGRSDLQRLLASLIGRAPEMPPAAVNGQQPPVPAHGDPKGQSERRPVGVRPGTGS